MKITNTCRHYLLLTTAIGLAVVSTAAYLAARRGEHSEADFTHGICPECAQELYPDYVNRDR